MESLKNSLKEALREEFFPYINELQIQEKLQTNGYFISNVVKSKGVISFKAKNGDKLLDSLLFIINEITKSMSIVGMTSQIGGKSPFLIKTILVSSLPESTTNPFFNAIDKISYNSSFLINFQSYIKGYNSNFFFREETNFSDELLFCLMSRFKAPSVWSFRKQNLLVENGIFDLLKNVHATKLPLISELSVIKKRKLKNEIVDEIVFSFLKGREFPQKRLSQLVNQGSSFLGLNIFPTLLGKVKYNAVEFRNLFLEIKETLHSNILNYLIAVIQSLPSDDTALNVSQLKTFHRKVFGKTLNNVTHEFKLNEFRVAGFSLHVLMTYLENHQEIISHFFENSFVGEPINISVNIHKERSSRVPLCIPIQEYETLKALYQVNGEILAVPTNNFDEIPF